MRTAATLKKYKMYRERRGNDASCDFCKKKAPEHKTFAKWKIVKNLFPYDKIAETHDMLIPNRHFVCENEMNASEREELVRLKVEILASLPRSKRYHAILENFQHSRTVAHYHIHLIRLRK